MHCTAQLPKPMLEAGAALPALPQGWGHTMQSGDVGAWFAGNQDELVLEGEVRIGGQVRAALGRQPDLGGHARPLLPPSLLHHKAPLAGCQRAPGGSWPQGRLLE